MSKEEVMYILRTFDSSNHAAFMLQKFKASAYHELWSRQRIMEKLEEAFSNGFVAIHFVPTEYEGCITEILEDYLGDDHFLAYRMCASHGMLCLEPNFRKLGVSPSDYIKASFMSSRDIHSLRHSKECVSFCYE